MSSASINNNAGLSAALSSLNIGDGAINNEEREATDDRNTATILCANCGKEGGDNMNSCNKCDLVVYCNAACKKKHRSKHKKKCEKRAAELYDEKLFRENLPREECPICMLLLHHDTGLSAFFTCCGKIICNGCIYAIRDGGKNIGAKDLCPFCRTPKGVSVKEEANRVNKLVENGNANGYYQLAASYANGTYGIPQDQTRSNKLFLKAGELGCAHGYFNIGLAYEQGTGVTIDKKKAKHYFELAAMNGDINAKYNLGIVEGRDGNHQRALKHFLLAAKAGDNDSLDNVTDGYMDGFVTKEEYANTLREYQKSQDGMKSDARDKAVIHGWMNY